MSAWCQFKIGRLSDSRKHQIDETDVAKELLDLQSTGSWDGLHIVPDAEPAPDGHWQFPRISADWEAGGDGYVVQCFETAESRSSILSTSADLTEPEVFIELGGQTQELWPRQLFVSYDLALRALQQFLLTGLQDPALNWIALNSFPRKTVKRPTKRN